jgi:chromate transporter
MVLERPLALLVCQILLLSSVAVGGFITIVPDLHRFVVGEHGWMSDERFVTLFALAQAAPGPNVIVVTLIGWEVAGALGALLATIAACLPTLIMAFGMSKVWSRYSKLDWYRTFERGVAPFAVGLIIATAWILTEAAARRWQDYLITIGTVVFIMMTRRSPLIPLAIAGALGAAGLI